MRFQPHGTGYLLLCWLFNFCVRSQCAKKTLVTNGPVRICGDLKDPRVLPVCKTLNSSRLVTFTFIIRAAIKTNGHVKMVV